MPAAGFWDAQYWSAQLFESRTPVIRKFSFVVLVVVVLLIAALFFRVMISFVIPMFLAALLVVVFHPLHDRIAAKIPERRRLAGALSTLVIVLIV